MNSTEQAQKDLLNLGKTEADKRVEVAEACVEYALSQVETETARLRASLVGASCYYADLGESLDSAMRILNRALCRLDSAKSEQGRMERLIWRAEHPAAK